MPVFAKVSTPALPVKLASPAPLACVIEVLAACVTPMPFTVKVPVPTLILPRTKASLLKSETLLLPLLLKETAPVKLFALPFVVKSMALPPAVKLAVPGTVMAPVCVIAPPAVRAKLPPFVKVSVGTAIAEFE